MAQSKAKMVNISHKPNKKLVKNSTVNNIVPYTIISLIMKHYDRQKFPDKGRNTPSINILFEHFKLSSQWTTSLNIADLC